MRADHVLKCHGFCKCDREELLAGDETLRERLESLPEKYLAVDVDEILTSQPSKDPDALLPPRSTHPEA